ncbi:MAG: gluconate 2-dehydrogenase subunit 3 family protein [Sphingomonas bacterium]
MPAIDRRAMLASVGSLIGLAALPAGALAAVAAPAYLDKPTTMLVTAFADTLIPKTDTPGAVQAGVPASFDALMRDWAAPAHRAALLASLKAIDEAAATATGKAFTLLTPEQRTTFLSAYDANQFLSAASGPASPAADYLKLKELVATLYYLSEPGSTVELRYEQVPGAWEASIPLTPETRAWAGANVG